MALNPQSVSAEDSLGRQLPISKKLSRAISSVPRSRFQKPRPNLPGSKRPDSSTSLTNARKPVEISQPKESKTTNALKPEKASQPKETKTSNVLEPEQTVGDHQNEDKTGDAVLNTNSRKVADKLENTITTAQERHNEDLIPNTIKTTKCIDSSITNVINETPLNNENSAENPRAGGMLGIDDNASKLCTYGNVEKGNDLNSATVSDNSAISPVSENRKEPLSASKEKVSDCNNSITPTLSAESSVSPAVQERNETSNISSVTDKSSKYPHLTSILSKKRSEPKKEVQHKKRRKFKKGDVAPERSKMTMADLIYWNPTNTDQSVKKTPSVKEVPTTTIEEEECVDEELEESNVCDFVPKLKLSEDGQIHIDEASLMVSRNIPQPKTTVYVSMDETTYSSFRKRPLTKHWGAKDTTVFYKALSLVGTDFSLMEKIFPHRTRRELKHKFKREEKYHIDLINRAMYESQLTFDGATLEELINHLNSLSDGENSENGDDCPTVGKTKKKSSNKKQKVTKITQKEAKIAQKETEITQKEIEIAQKETNRAKKVTKRTLKETKKTKSATEIHPDENGNKGTRNKRKRTPKKLPEDFIDIEDIDDITESIFEVAKSSETNEQEDITMKTKTQRSSNDFVDSSVIENIAEMVSEETNNNDTFVEITLSLDHEINQDVSITSMGKTKLQKGICLDESVTDSFKLSQENSTDASSAASQIPLTCQTEKEEDYIPVEYVETVNSGSESTLLDNVMAYEVVTSQMPVPRRKRKAIIPKIPKKRLQTCIPAVLSPTNYTPMETGVTSS